MVDRQKTRDQLQATADIPDSLKAVMTKSIHEDPAMRFATATEFAEAIYPSHKRR